MNASSTTMNAAVILRIIKKENKENDNLTLHYPGVDIVVDEGLI